MLTAEQRRCVRDTVRSVVVTTPRSRRENLADYAAIPAKNPDVRCYDEIGAIYWAGDRNGALLAMPTRADLAADRAEHPPQMSSGHTSPLTKGIAVGFSGPRRQTYRL